MIPRTRPAVAKVEVLCHATEEPGIVRSLILRLVPKEALVEDVLYGHYKNKIIMMHATLEKHAELIELLSKIPAEIPPVIEGSAAEFFLAKDPEGEWREADGGEPSVRVKVSFQVFPKGAVLDGQFFSDRKWMEK